MCYQSKAVCEQCKLLGQVSHLPSLRFCDSCHDKDVPCFRCVLMIVCSNCEIGNKTAFKTLTARLEADAVDPNLVFLPVSSDCPHVGKSIKSAFSNWWLKCRGEQINLALVRTLRNRSDRATKDKFKRLIPKKGQARSICCPYSK